MPPKTKKAPKGDTATTTAKTEKSGKPGDTAGAKSPAGGGGVRPAARSP
ncbi:hypothetical protein ACH4SK_28255 [Streptomyces inhibens]